MSERSLLGLVLGVKGTVFERWSSSRSGTVVVHVRPVAGQRDRCGRCCRRCPRYDAGGGRRRWRSLDLGGALTFLEADAPRVSCPTHGVVVAYVPWAEHGSWFTHDFEAQTVWLALRMSRTAAAELMRTSWRAVTTILSRTWNQVVAEHDLLDGLSRIGIDEISYRRGQRFITVVVNHDTGRMVWAKPGRDAATLASFFDDLGPERTQALTHVSCDQAGWINGVVTARNPHAALCADPFHLVKWANEAVTKVRSDLWRQARQADGGTRKNGWEAGRQRHDSIGEAKRLADARYVVWKNPENLTPRQQQRLVWIAETQPDLWEAYRLKEGLRLLLKMRGQDGHDTLEAWLDQATHSKLEQFRKLATRIQSIKPRVQATITHGLSNGLAESINAKVRLITRIAYGFHSPQPLIALAMLSQGHHTPQLPRKHP